MSIWQRLAKWLTGIWSRPKPRQNKTYEYYDLEVDSEPITGIKVIDGPYKGVIYYYTFVRIHEEPALRLEYGFRVKDASLYTFAESEEFKTFVGDILVSILLDEAQGEYATLRKYDSEKSYLS